MARISGILGGIVSESGQIQTAEQGEANPSLPSSDRVKLSRRERHPYTGNMVLSVAPAVAVLLLLFSVIADCCCFGLVVLPILVVVHQRGLLKTQVSWHQNR